MIVCAIITDDVCADNSIADIKCSQFFNDLSQDHCFLERKTHTTLLPYLKKKGENVTYCMEKKVDMDNDRFEICIYFKDI